MTTQEMIGAISRMTTIELAELTKELQRTFGVTPMSMYPQMANTPSTPEPVQQVEPTEFDVYIVSAGDRKIQIIKRVRELTTLGLKEAKDLVDHLPAPMRNGVGKEEAEKLKTALETEGAIVELRPS